MSNLNKNPPGSEKLKQLQNLGSNTIGGIKRTHSLENVDNASKKIKHETTGNDSSWREGNDGDILKVARKDSTAKVFTASGDIEFEDKAKPITVNSKIPLTNNELLVTPLSPQHNTEDLSNEYVLYASDLTDYVNDGECLKHNSMAFSSSTETPVSSLEPVTPTTMNRNTITGNDVVGATPLQDCADGFRIGCLESRITNEIELVLLPSVQENKVPLQTNTEIPKPSSGAHIVSSSSAMRHGAVTFTRITTASSLPSGLQSTAAILSRMNVPSLKNQQLVVTTKKLPSEVAQTTAKVSIGNTTISVPLLKPLNTPQLIHTTNLIGDTHKSSQATVVQSHTSQTQFNLSKILNVKRSQKGNQPTIVSLSQLQIKPVSAAQLVQAKVFNKKLPQVAYTMSTNVQSNAGVSTKTPSKPNQNYTSTVFCTKKYELPVCAGEDELKESGNTTGFEVAESSTELPPNEPNSVPTNFKKSQNEKSDTSQMCIGSSENNTSDENITSSVVVKKVMGSKNVNILPLLTPLSKTTDQQILTNLYPTVSIIRQTTPKFITTSATGTCVSKSTNISDTNSQPDLHSNKTPITLNSFCGKLNATPVISIPRNISLMLAKNNINHQAKTTFVTAKVSSTEQKIKKVNLAIANGNNVSPVTVSQTYGKTSESSESIIKQAVISVSVQPSSSSNSPEQTLFLRKPVKLTPNVSNLGFVEKRAKVPDSADQSPRPVLPQTNVSNLDSLGRRRTDNQLTLAEISGEHNIITIASVCDTTTDSGKANNDNIMLGPVAEDNIISNSKSDESNNALLKQLLQNSNTSNQANVSIAATGNMSSTTSMCSQVLSARKVINVRAPSLGLVSSLEAQLARPVIPPVPTTTSSHASNDVTPTISKPQDFKETLPKNSNYEIYEIQNDNKSKHVVQIISKETSFVSNPNKLNSSDDPKYSQSPNTNLDIAVVSANYIDSKGNKANCDKATAKLESLEESGNISHKDTSEVLECNSYLYRGNTILTIPTLTTGVTSDTSSNTISKLKIRTCTPRTHPDILSTNSENNNGPENETVSTLHGQTSRLSTVSLSNENGDKRITKSSKVYNRNILDTANNANLPVKQQGQEVFTLPETQENYVTKNIEMRKKRKRDYQKHRRQLLNNNDSSANAHLALTTSNIKKRPRKISKIEEDYDSFIENLITHLRQMKPLKVLEPLLNLNWLVGNAYAMNRSTFERNECGDEAMTFPLLGTYGFTQFPNELALYDTVPFCSVSKESQKQLSAIQNEFYDQEFSTSVRNNEQHKTFQFYGIIRDRNIETLDVISSNRNSYYEMNCSMGESSTNWINMPKIVYPGLVLMNKSNSHYLGRMSPILPSVGPTSNGKKYVVLQNDDLLADIENVKQRSTLDSKQRNTSYKASSNQVVTLSMPLSSVDNVIGVLKDLANLLHIAPPTMYKIIDAPTYNSPKQHPINQKKSTNFKKKLRRNTLQKILCGREKYCYNCGQAVGVPRIRAHKIPFCDSNSSGSFIAPMKLYFCSKMCYQHAKELGKIRDMQKTSKAVIRLEFNPECKNIDTIQNFSSKSRISDKMNDNIKNKKFKNGQYKYFSATCFHQRQQLKHIDDKNINMFKIISTTTHSGGEQEKPTDCILKSLIEDTRQCILCYQRGDGLPDGPSRLLNFEINKWVHLNCALWSNEVYETISGGLMNFQVALQIGLNQSCSFCQKLGATVRCFKTRCGLVFHLPCAIKEQCVFYKNKTIHCQQHATRMEKEAELTSLIVQRRVFVERDENQQVASVMHHTELTNLLRIGTLIFLNVGQLLPHQLDAFHNFDYIYPVGYKIIRFYWSMRKPNKRCRYICSIAEVAGRPEFRIQVQEPHECEIDLRDITPNAVWQQILTPITLMRKRNKLVQLFPCFISGEDLFGLTEPSVVRIIESLPGVETLTDYKFKYGRNPLLELPLAINPSGAARTEPKQRFVFNWRKPHTQRTESSSNQRMVSSTTTAIAGEIACPYSKQFVHSKSSQYKKMKQEWRNNVYLARSKIQGLGLYAARDIEKHTMIIEYIGEVIRTEVSEIREKQYEAKNRGIYMFRLDEERVVDATLSGGLARYVNHACNPNCVTEIVDVDRELRIIIFAKRRINRGEELSYDYKFDIEDEAHKISCMCGAPNCRKWMN